MMRRELPPESADRGWWYVVPAVPTTEAPGLRPDMDGLPVAGWCAWYRTIDGTTYAAVRCPDPVVGVGTVDDVSVSAILEGWTRRPYGRIGGR